MRRGRDATRRPTSVERGVARETETEGRARRGGGGRRPCGSRCAVSRGAAWLEAVHAAAWRLRTSSPTPSISRPEKVSVFVQGQFDGWVAWAAILRAHEAIGSCRCTDFTFLLVTVISVVVVKRHARTHARTGQSPVHGEWTPRRGPEAGNGTAADSACTVLASEIANHLENVLGGPCTSFSVASPFACPLISLAFCIVSAHFGCLLRGRLAFGVFGGRVPPTHLPWLLSLSD